MSSNSPSATTDCGATGPPMRTRSASPASSASWGTASETSKLGLAVEHDAHRPLRWCARSPARLCGGSSRTATGRRSAADLEATRPRFRFSRVRVLAVVHHRNAAAGVFAERRRRAGRVAPARGSRRPSSTASTPRWSSARDAQVDQEDAHPWLRPEKALLRELIDRGTPLLGVCSRLAAAGRGRRRRGRAERPARDRLVRGRADRGRAQPTRCSASCPSASRRFQWHSYEWRCRPARWRSPAARLPPGVPAGDRRVWGIQFHAEVTERDSTSGSTQRRATRCGSASTPRRCAPRRRPDRRLERARARARASASCERPLLAA